jgi:hypothetical protein
MLTGTQNNYYSLNFRTQSFTYCSSVTVVVRFRREEGRLECDGCECARRHDRQPHLVLRRHGPSLCCVVCLFVTFEYFCVVVVLWLIRFVLFFTWAFFFCRRHPTRSRSPTHCARKPTFDSFLDQMQPILFFVNHNLNSSRNRCACILFDRYGDAARRVGGAKSGANYAAATQVSRTVSNCRRKMVFCFCVFDLLTKFVCWCLRRV